MPKVGRTLLHTWFKRASADERKQMSEQVGVSLAYIKSIAYGHRDGAWAVVMRMAHAARAIRQAGDEEVKDRLPYVERGDVSPICAECPFYQLCKQHGVKEVNGPADKPVSRQGSRAKKIHPAYQQKETV